MMGAGKTTVGRRLAPRLGLPFVDGDSEIERAAGMSVSELFELHGQDSFREGEARVMARLLNEPPHVIATGGGAVLHDGTRKLIKEKAISVWIKADINALASRATRRDTRPLLRNGDPVEILSNIAADREAFYTQADIHVDSQPGPHDGTVELIYNEIIEFLGFRTDDE